MKTHFKVRGSKAGSGKSRARRTGRLFVLAAMSVLLVASLTSQALAAKPVKSSAADLSVGITDTPDPARFDQVVTYVVSVRNAGPSNAVPSLDVTFVGGWIGGYSYPGGSTCKIVPTVQTLDPTSTTLHCDLNQGRRQSTTQVVIDVEPNPQSWQSGMIMVTGNVASDLPDPNTSNNQTRESTSVGSPLA